MPLLLPAPSCISVAVTLLVWLGCIAVALSTVVTTAQHLHLLGNNFRSETFLTVLACPFTGAQVLD